MTTNCSRVPLQMLLVFLLSSVSCRESVEGHVGGDALLPCIYDQSPPAAEVNVFWRDQDDFIVLDIKRGSPDEPTQDEKYRGRVFSFPEEYRNRNFSILMKTLYKNDTGLYDCYLTTVSYRMVVNLTVSNQSGGKSGGAAGPKLLLSALCLLLCFYFSQV